MNKEKNLIILAIDTSCDDTSVAVLRDRSVLSSVVSSQVELHKKWGGVVPDIARRAHTENIGKVYQEAIKRAGINEKEIDYVAVTYGPGLAIALEVGINFARELSKKLGIKVVKINHMEGHMLSSFLLNRNKKGKLEIFNNKQIFPALALLVSGNHTEIVFIEKIGQYKILGETLDDASGEAFDKVARMMNLGYPGGPILTLLADKASKKWSDKNLGFLEREGKKSIREISGRFGLTIPMIYSKDMNFSFSGIKTACLYKIRDLRERYEKDTDWSYDLSREFINAVSKSLSTKLQKAMDIYPSVKSVFIGGGVSNNKYIIREIGDLARTAGKNYFMPEIRFRSDNAAMIGIAAYYNILDKKNILTKQEVLKFDRDPMLKL